MTKLNDEERAQIRSLAAAGQSASEISGTLHRPRSTIASALKRTNGAAVPAANGHATDELEQLDAILAARWSALSRPERLRRLLA